MDLAQFLAQFKIENTPDLVETLQLIEEKYSCKPDGEVVQVLELGESAIYQGEPSIRFMGRTEILNADAFLHVDFIDRGLLPLFDLYENDFICLRTVDKQFSVFNIIDYTEFYATPALSNLLVKLGFEI
ncbi:hypothetical protein [Paenibacillus sp. JDR-2]|uniref:hypothetical protein n=1 Tax=Paenibacillus sp. (strain JDR-2) TaxID=324057 RepID=UPI000166A22C|nr:hypothetical protein [Paenibacillus sp. JDR-2]ACT00500.1 hypothetical protein Pjdr2_1841 [Paenibacillus sp. JDR-2]